MKAEVLTVGDEILAGATTDTNSGWIARQLFTLGIEVTRVTQVGDRGDDIREAAADALRRVPLLIVTGGLGPTLDDRTKEEFAELFDDPLDFDEAILQEIRERFERRGLKMAEINRKQALMPRSGRKIPNPVGSAPGVHWVRDGHEIFLLPGVPREMQAMLEEYVLRRLQDVMPGRPPETIVFRTSGVPESDLAQRLQALVESSSSVKWAFYPSWHGVDVKLQQSGEDRLAFESVSQSVRRELGDRIYSEQAQVPLEEVLCQLLTARGRTLVLAESCTGGLIGERLTRVSGSSRYFVGAFVTYGNTAKRDWLGVPEELLEKHGAVSAEVAAAMAGQARRRAGTDLALAVTGIAGPTGGSADKPVGLVYLALSASDGCWVRRLQLGRLRDFNRQIASQLALDMVRRHELGLPVGDPFG